MNKDSMSKEAIQLVESYFSNITDGKEVTYSKKHIPAVGKSCHRSGSEDNIAWDAKLVRSYIVPTLNQSEKVPMGDISSLNFVSKYFPKKEGKPNAKVITNLSLFGPNVGSVQQKINNAIATHQSVYDAIENREYDFRFYPSMGLSVDKVTLEGIDGIKESKLIILEPVLGKDEKVKYPEFPLIFSERLDENDKSSVTAFGQTDTTILDILPALEFQQKKFEYLKRN